MKIIFSAGNASRIVLSFFIIVLSSCEKYLDVGTPKTQLPASAVFATDATAAAAMSSIYARAASLTAGGSGSITSLGAYLADETDNYSPTLEEQQLAANQLIATNTFSSSLWNSAYGTIYQCNALLEGLSASAGVSATLKTQLTGEAFFMRGLSHFYLSCFYGNVPLVNTTDYRENNDIVQTPKPQVLLAVIADLEQAKALLPLTYAPYANERIRPTKWAATALLSRVHLYAGNWQRARDEAAEVIAQTALFSLSPIADSFLKNAKEQILQYKNSSTSFNTFEGNTFILTAKPTMIALKETFVNGFEPGDLRRTNWTSKITVGGFTYFFPYKYKVKTATTLTEYSSMLRLSEQYLIRSEAQARLDQLPLAIADLDVIRERAGLAKLKDTNPQISKTALLEVLLAERRSELFTEWAHRWLDVQRFSKADAVFSQVKPTWQPFNQLFPIPDYDIRVNRSLKQNPGYQ